MRRCEDVRRCEMWEDVRCEKMSDVRRCQMWEDVRRCQMWEDVRRCQMWEDVRCEKMWEDVRCEKMWEDVRRCQMWEDVRRYHMWEDLLYVDLFTPPSFWKTLRSDALGKNLKGLGSKVATTPDYEGKIIFQRRFWILQVILAKPRAEVSKKGEAYRKWLCHIQFNLSVILLFYWDLYFCTKRFYCHVLENSCTCTRHAAITKSLSTCKKTTKRTLAHAFFCHGLVTSPCVVNRDTRMDQELSVQSRATGPRDESVACMSSRTLCTQVAIFARVSAKGKQLFCWRHSSKHCYNVCNSSMCRLCTRPKWCICGLYFAFRVYPGATDVNGRVSSLGFASQVRAKLASAKATVRLWNEVN